jgi:hypothetical protein
MSFCNVILLFHIIHNTILMSIVYFIWPGYQQKKGRKRTEGVSRRLISNRDT